MKNHPGHPQSIPNFSQRQLMLCFAYLAYCGEQITAANPETRILRIINEALPQIPPLNTPNPTWQVVWGPAVYKTPGARYQENMTFIAQSNADPAQLVVATRGTNRVADLDWLLEDFDVFQMMPWPPGTEVADPVERISESTSIDLQIVLTTPSAIVAKGTTLCDFLQTLPSEPLNVCVTGHSLGGCLSSTLALYLKEQQASWDHSKQSIVSNISFAGPTAGNEGFASYSDSVFSGGPFPPGWDTTLGSTCDAVRCSLDVAPLGWDSNNVAINNPNVVTLYGDKIKFHGLEWWLVKKHVIELLTNLVAQQNYRQIKALQALLPGVFHGKGTRSCNVKTILEAYAAEAGWQHGHSYPTILQVPSLLNSNIISMT